MRTYAPPAPIANSLPLSPFAAKRARTRVTCHPLVAMRLPMRCARNAMRHASHACKPPAMRQHTSYSPAHASISSREFGTRREGLGRVYFSSVPEWRNGRRGGLKNRCLTTCEFDSRLGHHFSQASTFQFGANAHLLPNTAFLAARRLNSFAHAASQAADSHAIDSPPPCKPLPSRTQLSHRFARAASRTDNYAAIRLLPLPDLSHRLRMHHARLFPALSPDVPRQSTHPAVCRVPPIGEPRRPTRPADPAIGSEHEKARRVVATGLKRIAFRSAYSEKSASPLKTASASSTE